jgi:hypothetical protein
MSSALLSAEGTTTTSPYALSFSEPSIVNLLVVGSFLYFLNVLHGIFQFLFGAGLIGQLVLGAVYAVPLGNILPLDIQTSIGVIGYIGLLLLIVEGGLDARLDILSERRNLCICLLVAVSGIGLPIGLSMLVLHFGYQYPVLEAFVVGAALSSTSLGTTFAIMTSFRFSSPHQDNYAPDSLDQPREGSNTSSKQSNLGDTRAGTILIGAALLDDIVGPCYQQRRIQSRFDKRRPYIRLGNRTTYRLVLRPSACDSRARHIRLPSLYQTPSHTNQITPD